MFLTSDGQVYACGLGADGQTGQGHYDVISRLQLVRGLENKKVVQISCQTDTVLAVIGE